MALHRALERLATHRTSILAILDDAESMLTDASARDIAGLALARWALMRELTAYQLFKHNAVLDAAAQTGEPRTAARARRLKQDGIATVDAFRANVTRWSATDVAAVWPTYQASALAMIGRVREQVARDQAELGSLAAGAPSGVIPPRADAPPRPGLRTPAD